MELHERAIGCLLGLAVGDAVGTTLEFKRPGTFTPIDDMVGGGPFGLEAGQWTDDTSMALCLADSLLHCNGFDAADQMQRYLRWWREGYRSVNGRCFDIGNTVRRALSHFEATNEPIAGPTDPSTAGNGSLMRLAPVALFYGQDRDHCVHFAHESSRTTHGAALAVECCGLFAAMLHVALRGDIGRVLHDHDYLGQTAEVRALAERVHEASHRSARDVRGSGYCVDALDAALWCFATTDNFGDAVLKAANLGDDADTTAAITGQIAGAVYGVNGIPIHWREQVAEGHEIAALAVQLVDAGRRTRR